MLSSVRPLPLTRTSLYPEKFYNRLYNSLKIVFDIGVLFMLRIQEAHPEYIGRSNPSSTSITD